MAPHADGSQVGEVVAAAGLGLDDVIDLGGSADADVGVAQLAPIAVSLEYPLAGDLPAGRRRSYWPVAPPFQTWIFGTGREMCSAPQHASSAATIGLVSTCGFRRSNASEWASPGPDTGGTR
jgi:hypothetical protein